MQILYISCRYRIRDLSCRKILVILCSIEKINCKTLLVSAILTSSYPLLLGIFLVNNLMSNLPGSSSHHKEAYFIQYVDCEETCRKQYYGSTKGDKMNQNVQLLHAYALQTRFFCLIKQLKYSLRNSHYVIRYLLFLNFS